VIKLIHATRGLTQGWPCEPERRASCKGEELFFFMMDDAVSSAAGAERPDIFSEMTAAASRLRRERRLGEHRPF
jgi:hypothetical protein